MPEDLSARQHEVRRFFAFRTPVLVVGPGCQRVGYADNRNVAWAKVTRRMRRLRHLADDEQHERFLDQLWRTKLSDALGDGPLQEHHHLDGERAEAAGEPATSADVRIDCMRLKGLALPALGTVVSATQCLGEIIRLGATPVTSWHDVMYPRGAASPEAAAYRDAARAHLAAFSDNAEALIAWDTEGQEPSEQEVERLQALGLLEVDEDDLTAPPKTPSEVVAPLGRALDALNITAVAASSRWLVDKALSGDQPGIPLSGALIEWLSDLLWHVLVCDTGVPPSQGEIAFYVNLREPAARRRLYTRARPGEYRIERPTQDEPAPDAPPHLTDALRRRLANGTHGLERVDSGGRDFGSDRRLQLMRTFAATLVTQWQRYEEQERPETVNLVDIPLALVSSHDLTLERQLMEILGRTKKFHVVVPVWVRAQGEIWEDAELDWLWGTYTKPDASLRPEHLTTRGGVLKWDWYAGGDNPKPHHLSGPVIVRVNGSPLLELAENVATVSRLKLPARSDGRDEIALATVFTELDSLRALMRFADASTGPAAKIAQQLTWDRRHWAFLGDSLPDWIPRLRLLFNALAGRHGAPNRRSPRKIAIDLQFDWPEEALLKALNVRTYSGDLALLVEYPAPRDLPEDADELATFLADVREHQPWR